MERIEKYDTFSLPLKRVYYNPDFNCRSEFTLQSISELAESIRSKGLNFPIVVRPAEDVAGGLPESFDYHLICGHRRFLAVNYLGWDSIPGMIRTGLSEHEARLLNLTENLERNDLNPLEEAVAVRRLFPEGTMVKTMMEQLKRSHAWVRVRLDLLALPFEIQQYVAARMLTLNDAAAVMTLPESHRLDAARKAIKGERQGVFVPRCRKYQAAKKRPEISRMIERLFAAGLDGLPTRLLAWVAGGISDEEITAAIGSEISRKSAGCAGRNSVEACDASDCRIIWNPGWEPPRCAPDPPEGGDAPRRPYDDRDVPPARARSDETAR